MPTLHFKKPSSQSHHQQQQHHHNSTHNTGAPNTTSPSTKISRNGPSIPASASLSRLSSSTSKTLLSQQNIPSLAAVVKELVENALDAIREASERHQIAQGSSNGTNNPGSSHAPPPHIQIHLKQYGLHSISISDNATGIPSSSHHSLTKQYHTSKISSMGDFDALGSFGFRGVALGSICNACGRFRVLTRTPEDETALELQYSRDLKLLSSAPVARDVGTTVLVEDLFAPFPVRRKLLEKSVKREYQKALKWVQSYALMMHHVRFTLINEQNNRRQTLFSTRGSAGSRSRGVTNGANTCLRDSICRVLGASQFKKMEEINLQYDGEMEESEDRNASEKRKFSLQGFISLPKSNKGRSQNDRQYLYLNTRPVDLPKLSKTVQEVYKQFNPHQVPAYVLNLSIAASELDVNVSTDKRGVFMRNEEEILDAVREHLEKKWNASENEFELANGGSQRQLTDGYLSQPKSQSLGEITPVTSQRTHLTDDGGSSSRKRKTMVVSSDREGDVTTSNASSYSLAPKKKRRLDTLSLESAEMDQTSTTKPRGSSLTTLSQRESLDTDPSLGTINSAHPPSEDDTNTHWDKSHKTNISSSSLTTRQEMMDSLSSHHSHPEMEDYVLEESQQERSQSHRACCPEDSHSRHTSYSENATSQRESDTITTFSQQQNSTISLDTNHLINLCSNMSQLRHKQKKRLPASHASFHASITDSHEQCDQELSRVVQKSHFNEMQVCGQFNKGFIITEHNGDLFIIDQHASDEKYNFELLQRTTRLNTQPLIVPKELDVSEDDIEVVRQNEDIFKRNGFTFLYGSAQNSNADSDEQDSSFAENASKLYLKTVPFSKHVTFGERDFHELLFLIQSCTQRQLRDPERRAQMRPSKVRDMFASRACRSSVMVGTTLSSVEMTKIVRQLSGLEKPWNCPHGRPTMRHLAKVESEKPGS